MTARQSWLAPVYLDYFSVPAGASRDTAVAQAAHDTLIAMFPGQASVYDMALATQQRTGFKPRSVAMTRLSGRKILGGGICVT